MTFPAVRSIGGQQPDLAAARNLCVSAGVIGPDGSALSEALAFGLAGGVGFLYGVFTYATGPTMTIVARNKSMPDPFVEPLFAASGASIDILETGSVNKAAKALDSALDEERPALCTVGSGALGYTGESGYMAEMSPHIVSVIGLTPSGEVLLDDRSPDPIPVGRAEFDLARATSKKQKHRMITISSVDPDFDWEVAIPKAVLAGAVGFDTPPVPQFASNIGVAGLAKFATLLTATNAKGWSAIFPSGPLAALGLSRLHDGIENAYTSVAAGRPLHADFLDIAASVTPSEAFSHAAGLFRESATEWAAIPALVANAHPGLANYVKLSAKRAALLASGPEAAEMAAMAEQQQAAVSECDIEPGDASEVYGSIAAHVERIVSLEQDAIAALTA